MRLALTVNKRRLGGFGERKGERELEVASVGDLKKGSLEEEERK